MTFLTRLLTLVAENKIDMVGKAKAKARQRNATSRENQSESRREESWRTERRECVREKRWTSAQKNRLLDEAVAGIPTNRKTTDGGIMGDSAREWTRGVACSAAEKRESTSSRKERRRKRRASVDWP